MVACETTPRWKLFFEAFNKHEHVHVHGELVPADKMKALFGRVLCTGPIWRCVHGQTAIFLLCGAGIRETRRAQRCGICSIVTA